MLDVIRITYGGANSDPKWYIRLGTFLDFIRTDLMYYVVTAKGEKSELLGFNTDVERNLMYVEALQVSVDPDICVINKTIDNNGTLLSFVRDSQNVHEFISSLFLADGYSCYGKIMNIYVNMKHILLTIDNLKEADTNKVPIINFLNTLLSSISVALGGVNNLEATLDENTNTVIIRDKNPLPNINYVLSKLNSLPDNGEKFFINPEAFKFDLYGYNQYNNSNTAGFIKDFNFTTELTPAFSTMISIGATANSTVVGENATALSRLNWGFTDRFKKDIEYANTRAGLLTQAVQQLQSSQQTGGTTQYSGMIEDLQKEIEKELSGKALKEKYQEAYDDYIKYITNLSTKIGNDPHTPTYQANEPQTYKNSIKDFINYEQQLREVQYNYLKLTNPSYIPPFAPSTGFIPFNMSLTMDGLSGMKIYNKFLVDTRYLPPNYTKACEFLIKNIEHKIENNKWTTKLESVIISKGEVINGQIVNFDENQQIPGVAPKISSEQVSDTAKIIYDFFISKGFNSIQSAAIVGNLYQESGLNSTITNSIGAYGLAQWLGSRKEALLKKPNYSNLQTQLNFIWEELQTTERTAYSAIKSANSLQEAVLAVRKKYERPGEAEANDARRLAYAEAVLKKFLNYRSNTVPDNAGNSSNPIIVIP